MKENKTRRLLKDGWYLVLRNSTNENNTMSRNVLGGEGAVEDTEILVEEEITKGEALDLAEGAELGGDVERAVGSVHESNSPLTVGELTDPNLSVVLRISDSVTLDTERILIDSNDFLVDEDLLSPSGDVSEIVGHVERSSEDSPNSHLGLGFLLVETRLHTNDEHIGIVPVAGTSVLEPEITVTEGSHDITNGLISSTNIVVVSPEVAVLLEGGIVGPVTEVLGISSHRAGEENRSAGSIQEVGHGGVGIGLVLNLRVATVHLQGINTPISEGLSINLKETLGTGILLAGVGTVIVVGTEEEALVVDVVREPLHAMGETLGISNKTEVLVSLVSSPAVINVDTLGRSKAREGSIRCNQP